MDEFRVPTIQVFIAGHDDPVTINESDFDESLHRRADESAPEPETEEKRKPGRPKSK